MTARKSSAKVVDTKPAAIKVSTISKFTTPDILSPIANSSVSLFAASKEKSPPNAFAPIATVSPSYGIQSSSSTANKKEPLKTLTLSDFGIQAAPPTPTAFSPTGTSGAKVGLLKCCVIKAPGKFSMVYRIEPKNPGLSLGFYGERFLFRAMQDKKEWFTALSFQMANLYWYRNNEPVLNNKSFKIRLFAIKAIGQVPPKERMVEIGKKICQYLNAEEQNDTITIVDESNYFWMGPGVVWSDIIGYTDALGALLRETNEKHFTRGFYHRHKDTVLSYFHTGTMDENLVRVLDAPLSELHPSLRQNASLNQETAADELFPTRQETDHVND